MPSKDEQAAATARVLQFSLQWASIALLYYDYALTFPLEVQYIWRAPKRWQLSTILYICCRYALVANVLFLLAIAKKLGSSCDVWYKIIGTLSVFGRGAVIITLTARTFAVFGRDRLILAYFLVLGLMCIALDISHVPGLKCVGSHSLPIVNNLLSIAMVVFEFSAAILTTIRSVQTFRAGGPWQKQKQGFMYLVFEQGILYFCIVSLFTIGAVITNFRAPPGSFFQRLLNALTLPLSGLLTARFLLHIRRWSDKRSQMPRSLSAPGDRNSPPQSRVAETGEYPETQSRMWRTFAGTLSTIIEDFGEDPIEAAHTRTSVGTPASPSYELSLLEEVGKGRATLRAAPSADNSAVHTMSSNPKGVVDSRSPGEGSHGVV